VTSSPPQQLRVEGQVVLASSDSTRDCLFRRRRQTAGRLSDGGMEAAGSAVSSVKASSACPSLLAASHAYCQAPRLTRQWRDERDVLSYLYQTQATSFQTVLCAWWRSP
jgi:hypothetical protein